MYVTDARGKAYNYQVTESFRTGRRSSRQVPFSDRMNQVPIRGPKEGSLSFQRRKNDYYARVFADLSAAPKFHGSSSVDGGHSFRTIRVRSTPGSANYLEGSPGGPISSKRLIVADIPKTHTPADWWYSGALSSAGISPGTHASISVDARAQLNPLVNAAYHSMIPDLPIAGWGETVVELARGNFPRVLPDLVARARYARELKLDPKKARRAARALGSDYLNARFGWEPVIRDTVNTVMHLMSIHTMVYDNIKRKRMTPTLTSNGRTSGFMATGSTTSADYDTRLAGTPAGVWYASYNTFISARFRKAAPNHLANSFFDKADDWLRNVGVTERLAWDLTPWSWLLDWSGNIGNTIENAYAFGPDGRYTTDYAWATTKVVSTNTVEAHKKRIPGYGVQNSTYCSTHVTELRREKISPFGPGFTMPSMSAYQWSILVALGLAYKR